MTWKITGARCNLGKLEVAALRAQAEVTGPECRVGQPRAAVAEVSMMCAAVEGGGELGGG